MLPWRDMVDLHCHYLPGVDDGARTLEQGLELLRRAFDNGINRIVLTPHVHPGRYDNTLQSLNSRFETFRRAVVSAQIPVQIALGGEVRFGDELLPMLERGAVPLFKTANGKQTLLLEFPHNQIPVGAERLVRWFRQNNITPMIAHPERNKELMKSPERLRTFLDEGCLVQVTAAAVIGKFGDRAQRTARYFLDRNWVSILATDAHNVEHRPPLLREAAERVASWYGDDVALRLVKVAPAAMSAGNFNEVAQPKAAQAKTAPPEAASRIMVQIKIDERGRREPTLGDGDLCGDALDHMRSELSKRAHRAGTAGKQAARILNLMKSWQTQ